MRKFCFNTTTILFFCFTFIHFGMIKSTLMTIRVAVSITVDIVAFTFVDSLFCQRNLNKGSVLVQMIRRRCVVMGKNKPVWELGHKLTLTRHLKHLPLFVCTDLDGVSSSWDCSFVVSEAFGSEGDAVGALSTLSAGN